MTLLETHNIDISIEERNICANFNFKLCAGEIWGILGPNGIGKTTLLLTLAGLRQPNSGHTTMLEKQLNQLSAKTIAQSIGFLFQNINSDLPITVDEYMEASRFPHHGYFEKNAPRDKQIIQDALQLMALSNSSNRSIPTLSGGEKRRLAIAAVLAQTPLVYLLDEPTNHLDMHYQLHTLTHFQHLATSGNHGIIMSLHDINLAQRFCSHILMMFPDGSMQQGRVCDILTEENLSRLYRVPLTAINWNDKIIWGYQ